MATITGETTSRAPDVQAVARNLQWLVGARVPYKYSMQLLRGGLALAMVRAAGGNSCRAAREFKAHRNTLDRALAKAGMRTIAREARQHGRNNHTGAKAAV